MPSLNFFPLFEVTRSTVPYGKVIQQSTAMGVHSPTFLCMKFDLFEFKYKIVSYLYSVPIYVRINVSFLVNIFENYCLELPSKARFFCFYSEVFSLNFFSMKLVVSVVPTYAVYLKAKILMICRPVQE